MLGNPALPKAKWVRPQVSSGSGSSDAWSERATRAPLWCSLVGCLPLSSSLVTDLLEAPPPRRTQNRRVSRQSAPFGTLSHSTPLFPLFSTRLLPSFKWVTATTTTALTQHLDILAAAGDAHQPTFLFFSKPTPHTLPKMASKTSAVADEPIEVLFALHPKFDLLDLAGPLEVLTSALHDTQDPGELTRLVSVANPAPPPRLCVRLGLHTHPHDHPAAQPPWNAHTQEASWGCEVC